MKLLTIIFRTAHAHTSLLIKGLREEPVFKILQNVVKQRVVTDIFEGRLKAGKHVKYLNSSDVYSTYFVLTVELNSAVRANSESIWTCLLRFAQAANSRFELVTSRNYQVVQFVENVKLTCK